MSTTEGLTERIATLEAQVGSIRDEIRELRPLIRLTSHIDTRMTQIDLALTKLTMVYESDRRDREAGQQARAKETRTVRIMLTTAVLSPMVSAAIALVIAHS